MTLNKWMKQLRKHDAARNWEYDPYANPMHFGSPGLNFLFGKTHGYVRGQCVCIYGPNKAGKTVLCYDAIAKMHAEDSEGIALYYSTELRDEEQMTPERAHMLGIDFERYQPYITNAPEKIFDHIENEVAALLDDGAPIRLIIIDSLTNIKGRKMAAADSVNKNVMGDEAATQQTGLKRIADIIHKHRVGFIITCQVRAEFDEWEKKRNGVDYKMAGGWYLKHYAGYVLHVQRITGAKGESDLNGNKMENTEVLDGAGNAELTGYRMRVKMMGNSFGPKGRAVELSFDYNTGFIKQYDEVATLAINRNIVDSSKSGSYVLADWPRVGEQMTWRGKDNFWKAVAEGQDLQAEIVTRLRKQDFDVMKNGANSVFFREEETRELEDGQEDFAD